ncbi:SDR family oxidoreductase [Thermoflavimicrobium dichotomicum]|uniref:UDP-glucose 4-epimerase n=1 Tax=Thermoflavimicrobium dichotomicum TaxID=46223 RepID=A0A1I3JZ65_9BACL|nr:SDR family oxidoreductase [Thermoflavimicrobium dichotomicum]SFI65483.1 UDP-glucose 4-epimerase [Thermoflavimicrobium dichotomicum]
MKVLVTGGAGFVGSHIVDQLIARGDQVAIVDDMSTGKEEYIHPSARFYRMDITSEQMEEVFAKEKPEIVIHQAAQILVPVSVEDPVFDAKVNILGTLNLLEACRKYGVKKIVYASSAAVYGNPKYLPIDEKHPIQPLSGYGISKHTPEHYLTIYRNLYGLEYTVLRYANIYGIRQEPHGEGGVVSILINQMIKGKTFKIFGDGEQTRDYIYVEDVAKANLAAIQAGDGHILNIGTGISTSLNELIRLFETVTNQTIQKEYEAERPGDIKHSYFDNTRARSVLAWEPTVSLKEGLRRTYEYYVDLYRKMGVSNI